MKETIIREYESNKLVKETEITEEEAVTISQPLYPSPWQPYSPYYPPYTVTNSDLCTHCSNELAAGRIATCGCVRPSQQFWN